MGLYCDQFVGCNIGAPGGESPDRLALGSCRGKGDEGAGKRLETLLAHDRHGVVNAAVLGELATGPQRLPGSPIAVFGIGRRCRVEQGQEMSDAPTMGGIGSRMRGKQRKSGRYGLALPSSEVGQPE